MTQSDTHDELANWLSQLASVEESKRYVLTDNQAME